MKERAWLRATDPQRMLSFLRGQASDRKLRLFLCALSRRVWPILSEGSQRAVEVAERLADGLCSEAERLAAFEAAGGAWSAIYTQADCIPAKALMTENLDYYCGDAAAAATQIPDAKGQYILQATKDQETKEAVAQCDLLRELFGNPFRSVSLRDDWMTSGVLGLTRSVYEEKRFDQLPILADALEDAGCAEEAPLAHCRQGGEHVRGCWVVDLVLRRA